MFGERDYLCFVRSDRGRSEYYERDFDREERDKRRDRRARSAVYDYEQRWEDEREDRRDLETGRGRRLRRLHTVEDTARYVSTIGSSMYFFQFSK